MNAAAEPLHDCVDGWLIQADDTVLPCPTCRPSRPRLESAHARRTDPLTSHTAAASVKVSVSEDFVLGCLKDLAKPVMDEQLIDYVRETYPDVGFTDSRLRTARGKLVEKGLVRFAGRGRSKRDKPSNLWEVA